MKLKSILPTLILLTILAATFAVTPVFSLEQRGPEIDKLRFKVIKGAGGGGYSRVPVGELYVDEFDEAFIDWSTVGASPYLDAVDSPTNYIEGTEYSSLIGFFSFEDTTLGADEFDSGTIEAYAMSEDPEIDGDIYLFAGPYSWVWAGSIEAGSYWSWTVLDLPSYLLDPVLINDMKMVIHYWTPEGTSRGTMTVDAVKLVLSQKGDWVPSPPVLALQNCEVDVVTELIRPENIEKLDEECYTITATPGFHICHIGFNIRPDQSYRRPEITYWPLADVNFRHALVHGYDQLRITATIYGFTVTPVRSLVPPAQGGWYNPSVPEHSFNPGDPFLSPPGEDSTCGILMAAGYTFVDRGTIGVVDEADYWNCPDGSPLPRMVIWTPPLEAAPTSYQHGAEFIADLATVGLKATTENGKHGLINESADPYYYQGKVFEEADFDGYMLCWKLGRFPTHLYDMTHSSQDCLLHPWGGNAPGINDPELDALTETVRFSLDHDAKLAAAHEAQSRLFDPSYPLSAFAYMNLYSRNIFNVFKPGLGGVIDSPGYGSDNMWTFLNLHWQPHPNERIEDGKSTVIWCLNEEPESLNPLYAHTVYAWEILDRVCDPLMSINPYTHEDLAWLAESWTIELFTGTVTLDSENRYLGLPAGTTVQIIGGMKVTFNLNDNVEWQDGNLYTPQDAEFNLEFLRNNQIPRYASIWKHIVDVQVTGATTFTVYTGVTSQWLLYDFADTAALLPPPVWIPLDGQPLATILSYDPSTDTAPKPGVGPKFGTEACPTCLYGTGPFVFQFYDPVCMYAEMLANRQYFKTTAEIQDQLVEMFWACGDVNRDGVVDQIDKDRYEAAYGCIIGDPCYDPDCDLNSDGIIDVRDGARISFFFGKTREVRKAVCFTSVYVDIKPASWPNPLELKNKGVLPVAICGTEEFDVTTINPETIRLTREGLETEIGVAPIRWSYEDIATPYTGEPCGGHDFNGDGYLDLVLKFKTQEVITKLELDAFMDQTIPLIISGYLKEEYGTTPIRGQDCVRIQE